MHKRTLGKVRFHNNPLLNRHLMPQPLRKELLQTLRIKLRKRSFFLSLKSVNPQDFLESVRIFYFRGQKVVIKDAKPGLSGAHGLSYEKHRKAFLQHQQAARQGRIDTSWYVLRTPKVYGRVGQYLIMEHVENKLGAIYRKGGKDWEIWQNATQQLALNISTLQEQNEMKIVHDNQVVHYMCAGIQNGKAIIYPVYDGR